MNENLTGGLTYDIPNPKDDLDIQTLGFDFQRTPILTAEEEVILGLQIEEARKAQAKIALLQSDDGLSHASPILKSLEEAVERGQYARRMMITSNIRLVYWCARKFYGRGVDEDDLVQAGIAGSIGAAGPNLNGLIHAVEKFDPRLGYKFGTYAVDWIRSAMQRTIANQRASIRVPIHVADKLAELAEAKTQLRKLLQDEPSRDELAEHLGISLEELAELDRLNARYWATGAVQSLDKMIGLDSDLAVGDRVRDSTFDPGAEHNIGRMAAEQLLGRLTARRQLAVRMSYGIYPAERCFSEREIADRIGYAVPALRQDITAALAQMASSDFDPGVEYLPNTAPAQSPRLEFDAQRLARHPLFSKYRGVAHYEICVERMLEILAPFVRDDLFAHMRHIRAASTAVEVPPSLAAVEAGSIMDKLVNGEFDYRAWQSRRGVHRSVLGLAGLAGIEAKPDEPLAALRARVLREVEAIDGVTDVVKSMVAEYYGLYTGKPVSSSELAARRGISMDNVALSAKRLARKLRQQRTSRAALESDERIDTVAAESAGTPKHAGNKLEDWFWGDGHEVTVERALAIVSPQQSQILRLRFDSDMKRLRPHAQTAAILGLSVSHVKVQYHQAAKYLAEAMPQIASGTFDYAMWEDASSARQRTVLGLLVRLGETIPAQQSLSELRKFAYGIVQNARSLTAADKDMIMQMYHLNHSASPVGALYNDRSKRRAQLTAIQKAIIALADERKGLIAA